MTAHIHAANMLLYAQDAAETDRPWVRWEWCRCGNKEWTAFVHDHPNWDPGYEYRRKLRTLSIGDREVPEPLRVAPAEQTQIYVVDISSGTNLMVFPFSRDCGSHLTWLARGLLHLTREAAAAHAQALIALSEVKP